SDEVAFQVTVNRGSKDGPRKLDLSRDQLWRGKTLDAYYSGRWRFSRPPQLDPLPHPPEVRDYQPGYHENRELPSLGPDQYVITFHIDRKKSGGLILAEPVILGPGKADHPYQALPANAANIQQLFWEIDGTLNPIPGQTGRRFSYCQVTAPSSSDRYQPRW